MIKEILFELKEHNIIKAIMCVELIIILWALGFLFVKPVNISIKPSELQTENVKCVIDSNGVLSVSESDFTTGEEISVARSNNISLYPGAYYIDVRYSAEIPGLSENEWAGGSEIELGKVGITSVKIPFQIKGDDVCLNIDSRKNKEPVWVNSYLKCSDLHLNITYSGHGNIYISEIILKERVYFRFTRLFSIILIFSILDWLMYALFIDKKRENKGVITGVVSIILFSSLPLFFVMLFYGHDLDFHLGRIAAIVQGIYGGDWLAKIQSEMVNGYGYATPLFYPNLFLYFPALLYIIGFPLQTSYQIFIFAYNAATCLICYFCINKIIKDKYISLTGSALYTLSMYRLTAIYIADRLGEVSAITFFPLIIYGLYSIYCSDENLSLRKCIPLIIGVSGIMQSHLISCFFTGIFLALFVMICYRRTFKLRRLVLLIESVIITVMLNLWFIVPFLDSMDMDIKINAENISYLRPSGVYPLQLFSIFSKGRGLNAPVFMQNDSPMTIGMGLLAGIVLFMYITANKNKYQVEKDSIWRLGIINCSFAVIAVIFSLSWFPWDDLSLISTKLHGIFMKTEFSWRFYLVAAPFAVFATVTGLHYLKNKSDRHFKIAASVIIGLTVASASYFFSDLAFSQPSYYVNSINSVDDFALGYTNDYQLNDTDLGLCYGRRIHNNDANVTVTNYSYKNGITEFDCRNTNSDGFSKIGIPLFAYPGYKAYDKATGELFYIESGNNKIIMVNIPANYEGTVVVRYCEKKIWRLAEILSLVTLSGLVAGFAISRGKIRK